MGQFKSKATWLRRAIVIMCSVIVIQVAQAEGSAKRSTQCSSIKGPHVPTPGEQGDPLAALAKQMDDIARDLGNALTGPPVQTKEKAVLAGLDQIIAQLEKQTGGSGGGANPNPTKPMQHSTLAKGPGGQGPLHDAQAGTRVWGQLPPKEREQILQSQTEGFPPGYESVLSSYYSHLAQGQVGTDASGTAPGPTPSPATQPATTRPTTP